MPALERNGFRRCHEQLKTRLKHKDAYKDKRPHSEDKMTDDGQGCEHGPIAQGCEQRRLRRLSPRGWQDLRCAVECSSHVLISQLREVKEI